MVFFSDAVEDGEENEHTETHHEGLVDMHHETGHQKCGGNRLDDEYVMIVLRSFLGGFGCFEFEDFADVFRHGGAVVRPLHFLEYDAGDETTCGHPQGDMAHLHEELHKAPAHQLTDEEVLWFADKGQNAAKHGADGGMHHDATQKRPELIEVLAVILDEFVVVF